MQCERKLWSESKNKWVRCGQDAEYELRPAVEDPVLKDYFTVAYGKKPRAKKLCVEHVQLFEKQQMNYRAGGAGNPCIEQKTFKNVSDAEKWWMRAKPKSVFSGSNLNPYPIWALVSLVHRAAKMCREVIASNPNQTDAVKKSGQLSILSKEKNDVVNLLWEENLAPILKNPKSDGDTKKESTDRFQKIVSVYTSNMSTMMDLVLEKFSDPKFHSDCNLVMQNTSGMSAENQIKTLFKSNVMVNLQKQLMPSAKNLCPTSSNWFGLKQNPRCPMHGAMVVSYLVSAATVWAYTTAAQATTCPTDEQLKPIAQLVSCWMADVAFWDETKACSFVYTI